MPVSVDAIHSRLEEMRREEGLLDKDIITNTQVLRKLQRDIETARISLYAAEVQYKTIELERLPLMKYISTASALCRKLEAEIQALEARIPHVTSINAQIKELDGRHRELDARLAACKAVDPNQHARDILIL
eukprot:TRINITY_DN37065_c0_g1_i1.p1 TRINITY_DN37065_c0_g1~~TRINITY_DN37065_c0_g1_i1.p1  ORF type:complete len:132 (+),score=29.09 TRINITY_DN37065_c0_g1_i1:64-459(+)